MLIRAKVGIFRKKSQNNFLNFFRDFFHKKKQVEKKLPMSIRKIPRIQKSHRTPCDDFKDAKNLKSTIASFFSLQIFDDFGWLLCTPTLNSLNLWCVEKHWSYYQEEWARIGDKYHTIWNLTKCNNYSRSDSQIEQFTIDAMLPNANTLIACKSCMMLC